MVAEKITETDEEIIDLTELIEKGTAGAVPPPEKVKEEISSHMQSLNDAPARQDDAEIDALLAQMETNDDGPGTQLSPEQAAAPSHKVDPHEELDMSGMGDVDKLLSSLDIPPQPRGQDAETAQKATPMDLDSAVDDLLKSMNGSAPKPESEAAPDVHDLLAAAPQLEEQNFADDLDALLASTSAAPAAKPASEELETPDVAASPSALAADPAPDLTDDLDNLMAGLDLKQDAPVSAPETENTPEAAPKKGPQAQATPQENAANIEMELDALLASVSPDADMPESPAADADEPAAQAPLEAVVLEPELELPAETTATTVEAANAPDVPVEKEAALEGNPDSGSEPELDLDALLQSAIQEESAPDAADTADLNEAVSTDEASAVEKNGLPVPGESPEPAETEAQPEVGAELPVPPVEDPLLIPVDEEAAPASGQTDTPLAEAPAAPRPVSPAPAAVPLVEPAPAVDAADLAQLAELAEENAHLAQRLQHCERELTEAKARISALEKAMAAPAASLEDLLREGTLLHDRFAALISSSVGQALKAMPAPVQDEALGERLHNLSLMGKSVSVRMDALESRLDTLEPRFNQQVEKAAAGAAARILREEIAKLVQD